MGRRFEAAMAPNEGEDFLPKPNTTKRRPTQRQCLLLVLIVLLLAVIVAMAVLTPLVFLKSSSSSQPSSGSYRHAAVAADVAECSEAGVSMLRLKGSAVDAAIAAMLCLGVVNGHSSGLGGGAIMLVYQADSKSKEVIDAREVAPSNAYKEMYVGREELSTQGGLAVAVPGEVAGMRLAWERHGRLNWSQLFNPAIKIAKDGFKVTKHLADALEQTKKDILADVGLRELYTKEDGETLYKEGETLKRPVLARTLEMVAADPNVFYKGEFLKIMVEDINKNGGNVTEEDFLQYTPIVRNALSSPFNDLTTFGAPPPASGPVGQLILAILDLYNKNTWDVTKTLSYQHMVEAMKYAYGQRQTLGDPAFSPIVNETLANMTNPDNVRRMFELIWNNRTFEPEHYVNWFGDAPNYGTSHLCVLDEKGNAVAATTTINTYFGCKIRSPSLGIIYNNEMDDFATPNLTNFYGLPPSPTNFIAPGKRPQSSVTPTVIVDNNGEVRMVVGASGGSRIITATALTIINNMIFKDNIGDAIERARLHHQLIPNEVTVEVSPPFPEDIIQGLEEIGHEVDRKNVRSVVQGITRDSDGTLNAACDTRKGGSPAGY